MRRWLPSLLLTVLSAFAVVPARAAPADSPHYVVQIQPAGKLLKTVREFYRKFATPQLGDQAGDKTRADLERQLDGVLGKGWRDAVDEERPLLLYGRVTGEKAESQPVAIVPVKSAEAARRHLRAMGAELGEESDGCQKCILPGQKEPVYLHFAGHHLYAARAAEALAGKRLLPPARLIDPAEKSAVAARVFLDRLPRATKEKLADAYKDGLREGVQGNLSGWLQEAVQRCVNKTEEWVRAVLLDGKELSLRLDLDSATGELKTVLRLTPQEGSHLADLLASVRQGPSLGAALLGGKPLGTVRARLALPEDVRQLLLTAVRQGVKDGLAKVENEKARDVVSDMAGALEPTVKEGVFDTALILHGPGRQDRYAAVLALQLKDAPAVEKAARRLIGFLPADNPLRRITFDADDINGVKVHRYPLGQMVPDPVQKLFGQSPAVIAFRKDGVLVAYGEGAKEHLGRALAVKAAPAPPLAVHAGGDPQRLAEMIRRSDPRSGEEVKKFAELFEGPLQIVQLSLVGGESLEVRASVNLLLMPRAASRPAPDR